jgi:pSer/pThr/pTyr-binding forkhead associated (FHA) protein
MEALLVRVPASPAQAGENKAAASPGEGTLLRKTRVTTIGRQQGVHLLIDHESVSRRHAEISYVDGQYVLRDLGSANGTRVNGTRLEGGNAYTLQPNDQVRFGKVTFVFQVRGGEVGAGGRGRDIAPGRTKLHEMATGFYDPDAAGQASLPSGQPVLHADGSLLLPGAEKAIPASTVASLKESPALIVVTSGQPTVFHLKRGRRITLGRDKGNDIVLAEIAASRKHAEVFLGPDGFYIRDLGSSNGVIVNRTKIDNPYLLAHGDRITIGSISLYFMNAGENVWGAFAQSVEPSNVPQSGEDGTRCGNCGAANIPTARFCANCGTPVGQVPVR